MVVSCPKCKARYKVDSSKIGEKGSKIRCTKCNTLFVVRKPRPSGPAESMKQAGPPKVDTRDKQGEKSGSSVLFDEATRIADPKLMAALGKMGIEDDAARSGQAETHGRTTDEQAKADDLFNFGDLSLGLDEVPMTRRKDGGEKGPASKSGAEVPGTGNEKSTSQASVAAGMDADLFADLDSVLAPDKGVGGRTGTQENETNKPFEAGLDQDTAMFFEPEPEAPAQRDDAAPAVASAGSKPDDLFADLDIPAHEALEGTFDASGEEELSAGEAPDSAAKNVSDGTRPGDSQELAKDLFADLSDIPEKVAVPEQQQPAAPTGEQTEERSAKRIDPFDFDNLDLGDLSEPGKGPESPASGEDLFGGVPLEDRSEELKKDFGLELDSSGGISLEPVDTERGGPAVERKQSVMFYAASEEVQEKERDIYGVMLAGVGIIAILVLVGALIAGGERIDFSLLTPGWLLGEKTLAQARPVQVSETRSYAYDSLSGRHLLVIEGKIENKGGEEMSVPGIKASIYDHAGRLLYARQGKLGCELTPKSLYYLAKETDLDEVCPNTDTKLPPGGEKVFSVVFFDGPEHLSRYSYSVSLEHQNSG